MRYCRLYRGVTELDCELRKMQDQADRISHVYLSRIKKKPKPEPQSDDGLLIMGLILILLTDGADMLTVMMLLYILG